MLQHEKRGYEYSYDLDELVKVNSDEIANAEEELETLAITNAAEIADAKQDKANLDLAIAPVLIGAGFASSGLALLSAAVSVLTAGHQWNIASSNKEGDNLSEITPKLIFYYKVIRVFHTYKSVTTSKINNGYISYIVRIIFKLEYNPDWTNSVSEFEIYMPNAINPETDSDTLALEAWRSGETIFETNKGNKDFFEDFEYFGYIDYEEKEYIALYTEVDIYLNNFYWLTEVENVLRLAIYQQKPKLDFNSYEYKNIGYLDAEEILLPKSVEKVIYHSFEVKRDALDDLIERIRTDN